MPCYLLHIVEQPESSPYDDPDLKDLVGSFPRCFCSQVTPVEPLAPSEVSRCLNRDTPCWKPGNPG